jgi:predicted nucleotidyltransferase
MRGTHSAWSDFDLLVVVRDKEPRIENEIISLLIHLSQEAA